MYEIEFLSDSRGGDGGAMAFPLFDCTAHFSGDIDFLNAGGNTESCRIHFFRSG